MAGFDENPRNAHQRMVRLVGNDKRVLEIGSGPGLVSERLARNGCNVYAVEIDPEKAEQAKKFCKAVFVGNVEEMELALSRESFDVILFGDVLEHLQHPEHTLERLKRFLKKDGRIVVSLPNVANWKVRAKLAAGKFEYEDWGILDRTHLRFFTRKTARKLIEDAGFEIDREEFVPSFPLPFLKAQLSRINPNMFAFQFLFAAKKK